MLGPKIAPNSTASQMTAIAIDAHISETGNSDQRDLSRTTPDFSCEVVLMSHLLSLPQCSRRLSRSTSAKALIAIRRNPGGSGLI